MREGARYKLSCSERKAAIISWHFSTSSNRSPHLLLLPFFFFLFSFFSFSPSSLYLQGIKFDCLFGATRDVTASFFCSEWLRVNVIWKKKNNSNRTNLPQINPQGLNLLLFSPQIQFYMFPFPLCPAWVDKGKVSLSFSSAGCGRCSRIKEFLCRE